MHGVENSSLPGLRATSQNILWSTTKVNEACARPTHVRWQKLGHQPIAHTELYRVERLNTNILGSVFIALSFFQHAGCCMWGYSSGGAPSIPPSATVLAAVSVAAASLEANTCPRSSVGLDVTARGCTGAIWNKIISLKLFFVSWMLYVTISLLDISVRWLQYLVSKMEFTVLNSPKGFWRSLPQEISLFWLFSRS